jgi:hypothetical protein
MNKVATGLLLLSTSVAAQTVLGQTYSALPQVWQALPIATYYSPSFVVPGSPVGNPPYYPDFAFTQTIRLACCSPSYIVAPSMNCPTYDPGFSGVQLTTSTPCNAALSVPTVSKYSGPEGPSEIEHKRNPPATTIVTVVNSTPREIPNVQIQYVDTTDGIKKYTNPYTIPANSKGHFWDLPGFPRTINNRMSIEVWSNSTTLIKGSSVTGNPDDITISADEIIRHQCDEITLIGLTLP